MAPSASLPRTSPRHGSCVSGQGHHWPGFQRLDGDALRVVGPGPQRVPAFAPRSGRATVTRLGGHAGGGSGCPRRFKPQRGRLGRGPGRLRAGRPASRKRPQRPMRRSGRRPVDSGELPPRKRLALDFIADNRVLMPAPCRRHFLSLLGRAA
jgi:hypothetical protein